jgi:heavy metal translocating P-type ATPase
MSQEPERPKKFRAELVHGVVAGLMAFGMLATWIARYFWGPEKAALILLVVVLFSSIPLLVEFSLQIRKFNFSVDVLAVLSIASAVAFRHYWVAAVVILMLSGGKALEDYATRRASSILGALARRMPRIAHRVRDDGKNVDVDTDSIVVGDLLALYPHELCPVDGVVIAGNGRMDESFLTGEPFELAKAPGATVISGSINGDAGLTIQATRVVADSRYARIVQVLRDSEANRPRIRRIADRLAAWYTPAAVAVAAVAWIVSGDPQRFLAVLVIATPCPLLLAVPVAIMGAISVAGRRGIVIKDPAILEKIGSCETLLVDKTGTLTYGRPVLESVEIFGNWPRRTVLQLAASVEQYSKHPLGSAVLAAARDQGIALSVTEDVFEIPGHGLTAHADGRMVTITGRNQLPPRLAGQLPAIVPGLESVILVDGELAGLLRFRDEPRTDTKPFLGHLRSHHGIRKIVLLSGDRLAEVVSFGRSIGITEALGGKSPEEKLAIVRSLTAESPTLYVGDGINDAPAMMSATAGIAMGTNSEITAEAAGAVILQSSLVSVDELIHIGARMRKIALTSAAGGLGLSALGMGAAALGYLKPIEGAVLQEFIDLASILYALRVALPTGSVGDFKGREARQSAQRSKFIALANVPTAKPADDNLNLDRSAKDSGVYTRCAPR